MKLATCYFALLLIFVIQDAQSQTDTCTFWTLDDCITLALKQNIDIKQQEATMEEKAIALSESKWNYTPDISFSNSYSISSGRVLDPTTYEFKENETVQGVSSSFSASIPLFNGLKKMYTLKRAKLDLRSSLLHVEKTRNDVKLNVTAYYLEILAAEESIRNAEQIVETLKLQEEKTTKLVEVHKVTLADLSLIQSQLAEAESDVVVTQNTYNVARLNLCQLLEIDKYTSFHTAKLNNDTIELFSPQDPALVIEAAQWLPQLEIAKLGINIALRDLQIARSSYYPTISLGVGYGTSFSDARRKMFQNQDGTYRYEAYPFFEQYRNNASKYLSINLEIPIFGRLASRKNVQKRKLAVRQAEYDLRVVEKQVIKEISQACIDAETARQKYYSSIKFFDSASEAARQIERKYNLGVATIVDYNVALNNLVKAQTQLLQTKYEYIFKMRVIDFYMAC